MFGETTAFRFTSLAKANITNKSSRPTKVSATLYNLRYDHETIFRDRTSLGTLKSENCFIFFKRIIIASFTTNA